MRDTFADAVRLASQHKIQFSWHNLEMNGATCPIEARDETLLLVLAPDGTGALFESADNYFWEDTGRLQATDFFEHDAKVAELLQLDETDRRLQMRDHFTNAINPFLPDPVVFAEDSEDVDGYVFNRGSYEELEEITTLILQSHAPFRKLNRPVSIAYSSNWEEGDTEAEVLIEFDEGLEYEPGLMSLLDTALDLNEFTGRVRVYNDGHSSRESGYYRGPKQLTFLVHPCTGHEAIAARQKLIEKLQHHGLSYAAIAGDGEPAT